MHRAQRLRIIGWSSNASVRKLICTLQRSCVRVRSEARSPAHEFRAVGHAFAGTASSVAFLACALLIVHSLAHTRAGSVGRSARQLCRRARFGRLRCTTKRMVVVSHVLVVCSALFLQAVAGESWYHEDLSGKEASVSGQGFSALPSAAGHGLRGAIGHRACARQWMVTWAQSVYGGCCPDGLDSSRFRGHILRRHLVGRASKIRSGDDGGLCRF